jgi:hypothetical protein
LDVSSANRTFGVVTTSAGQYCEQWTVTTADPLCVFRSRQCCCTGGHWCVIDSARDVDRSRWAINGTA